MGWGLEGLYRHNFIFDCQAVCLQFCFGHPATFCYTPPSIFSRLYFQGAKPPSFILIRAALELGSDEKSVRAHRLKIGPKFQTPPGGQISASFQKNQVLQKERFGLIRSRK